MQSCLNIALRLLSRRDHSCHELALKLTRRGFETSQVKTAIRECRRLNYLDDEGFCRRYAGQLRRKGYGIRRIEQMLKAKGVAPELIRSAMQHSGADNEQLDDCRKALAKRLKNDDPPATGETRAKIYRFLFNRGFSPDIIQRAFAEIACKDV